MAETEQNNQKRHFVGTVEQAELEQPSEKIRKETQSPRPMKQDYAATGGFLIDCQDGLVGVTKEEADNVLKFSPFFKGCFEHNMQESVTRRVKRSDWTISLAQNLVHACVDGSICLETPEQCQNLLEAADEAMIDLRLCDMIHYKIPSPKMSYCLSQFWNLPKRLEIAVSFILTEEWFKLLESNILLLPQDPQILLKVAGFEPENNKSGGKNPLRKKVVRGLSVHTTLSATDALFRIRECFKADDRFAVVADTPNKHFVLSQHPPFSYYLHPRFGPGHIIYQWETSDESGIAARFPIRKVFQCNANPKLHSVNTETGPWMDFKIVHPSAETLGRLLHAAAGLDATIVMIVAENAYSCNRTIALCEWFVKNMAKVDETSQHSLGDCGYCETAYIQRPILRFEDLLVT